LTSRPTNTEAPVGDHMPIWLPDTVYHITLARVWFPEGYVPSWFPNDRNLARS
jgi:hypothetical protein